MSTLLLDQGIEIPTIRTLSEFRRWTRSDSFPQHGRIDYLGGRIEIDMSPGDLVTHGTLKSEIASGIKQRVDALDLGHTLVAETRVSSVPADLSAEPDVMVITHQALDETRVTLTPKASGEPDRYVEVQGGPDLVVEIVSDSPEDLPGPVDQVDTHRRRILTSSRAPRSPTPAGLDRFRTRHHRTCRRRTGRMPAWLGTSAPTTSFHSWPALRHGSASACFG